LNEGPVVDDCDLEGIDEQAGALEVNLPGGDGLKEHGGGELDGFGVFERREIDLVLVGIGAGDGKGVLFGTTFAEDGVLLRIGGEGPSVLRALVGDLEAVVEEAEGLAGEGGRAA